MLLFYEPDHVDSCWMRSPLLRREVRRFRDAPKAPEAPIDEYVEARFHEFLKSDDVYRAHILMLETGLARAAAPGPPSSRPHGKSNQNNYNGFSARHIGWISPLI